MARSLGYHAATWDEVVEMEKTKPIKIDNYLIGDVRYDESPVRLATPLLGTSQVSIVETAVPLPYIFKHVPDATVVTSIVNAPIHHAKLVLHVQPDKREYAHIFLTPDSPLLAVHDDDVRYVQSEHDNQLWRSSQLRDFLEYDDVRIPGLVVEAFGPESVEVLENGHCRVLAQAVLQATVRQLQSDDSYLF